MKAIDFCVYCIIIQVGFLKKLITEKSCSQKKLHFGIYTPTEHATHIRKFKIATGSQVSLQFHMSTINFQAFSGIFERER